MTRRRAPLLRTAVWIAGAVLLAAVVFAPVLQSGYCAVAPASGRSYCDVSARSVVGIPTSLWLWLGATAALVAAAWWLALRRRRDDAPR